MTEIQADTTSPLDAEVTLEAPKGPDGTWYDLNVIRALAALVNQGVPDRVLLRMALAYEVTRPVDATSVVWSPAAVQAERDRLAGEAIQRLKADGYLPEEPSGRATLRATLP